MSATNLTGQTLRPDASAVLWKNELKNVIDGRKPENVVVEIVLSKAGKTVYHRLFYPASPRKQKLPRPDITVSVSRDEKGYLLDIQSDKLARNILIGTDADGFFSDNYFDLLPGERKTVHFDSKAELDVKKAFRIKSLVDTMH